MKIKIAYDGKRLEAMNYLKGYSILTIVLMHLIQMYMTGLPRFVTSLSSFGGTGVHVFFLCSGLGLFLSYQKRPCSFAQFIRKRFFKIYVPYIVIVFLSFLLPWMYESDDRLTALLSHVFLFKMFIPRYESSFGVQLWFVSTILQLYLLFIPMCKIKEKMRNDKLFFSVFMLISICWWVIVYLLRLENVRVWNSFCLQYIWEFALGMLIGEYFSRHKSVELRLWVLTVTMLAGTSLQFIMASGPSGLKIFNDIPGLIGYTSLALLIYRLPPVAGWIQKIAGFSYELYLIHILIFTTVFYLFKPATLLWSTVWGVIAFAVSMGAAILYHRIVTNVSQKLHTSQ